MILLVDACNASTVHPQPPHEAALNFSSPISIWCPRRASTPAGAQAGAVPSTHGIIQHVSSCLVSHDSDRLQALTLCKAACCPAMPLGVLHMIEVQNSDSVGRAIDCSAPHESFPLQLCAAQLHSSTGQQGRPTVVCLILVCACSGPVQEGRKVCDGWLVSWGVVMHGAGLHEADSTGTWAEQAALRTLER